MDKALLKEREAFKKRALAQPSVERKHVNKAIKEEPKEKRFKPALSKVKSEPSTPGPIDYKTATPTSSHKFAILHKVIDYLKKRHHRADSHPLTLDDLLDEAKMTDIAPKNKQWLATEALVANEKVAVIDGNKYKFKPHLPITSRKDLLNYLKRMDRKGLGGVMEEEVEEALPDAVQHIEKCVQVDRIILLTRPDKKRVLYFKDPDTSFAVDEEFQKLWRSVAVDGIDEKAIEDYLEKQGIASMDHVGIKRVVNPKRKHGGKKRIGNFKKLNDHLDGVLQDYSENK